MIMRARRSGTHRLDKAFDSAVQHLSAAGGDIDRLGEVHRALLLVHAAQGVIDNGGLQYFFESDFPGRPDYRQFVEAYRRIGAVDEASLLGEAVQLLGLRDAHLDASARREILPTLLRDRAGRFATIDRGLCGNNHVWEALDRYLAARDGT